MRRLDVAVIGCGSAGPAAALYLTRQGHRVTVFERASSLGPVGAGFMIQPTGLHVLAELGLAAPVLEHGAHLSGLRCETRRGATVLDLRYDELHPRARGIGLHRAVLLRFFERALADAGIDLVLGAEIDELEASGSSRWRLRERGGRVRGPFDLVVVADGARSRLRDHVPGRRRVREYAWGALWFIGEDTAFRDRLFQVVDGTEVMLGLLPTGREVAADGGDDLVSLFWSIRRDRVDAWRRAGLERWKERVLALVPAAEALVAQIDDIEQVTFAGYLDVSLERPHAPGLVVIGDAAHATSPQLGQGVNLGLWDAHVLAACTDGAADLDASLAAYHRRRRRHLRYYQWATRWLTPFFQSSSRVLGVFRNAGMGLMNRVGPARRMMISTMAGVRRGLLRRSMPLPPLLAHLGDGDHDSRSR